MLADHGLNHEQQERTGKDRYDEKHGRPSYRSEGVDLPLAISRVTLSVASGARIDTIYDSKPVSFGAREIRSPRRPTQALLRQVKRPNQRDVLTGEEPEKGARWPQEQSMRGCGV